MSPSRCVIIAISPFLNRIPFSRLLPSTKNKPKQPYACLIKHEQAFPLRDFPPEMQRESIIQKLRADNRYPSLAIDSSLGPVLSVLCRRQWQFARGISDQIPNVPGQKSIFSFHCGKFVNGRRLVLQASLWYQLGKSIFHHFWQWRRRCLENQEEGRHKEGTQQMNDGKYIQPL